MPNEYPLAATVRHVVEGLAARQSSIYAISDVARQTYAVFTMPNGNRATNPARAVVIARVIADYVLIDEDSSNPPLVEKLVEKGISRDKVALLYKGQPMPSLTATLSQVIRREISQYSGNAEGITLQPVLDDKHRTYTVIAIPQKLQETSTAVVVLAQVVDDRVVIIEDAADAPLLDMLVGNGGIPRERIVLAYAGESLPTG
jgi:hypothetical protein